MSVYVAPVAEMQFVLREVAGLDRVLALPGCEGLGDEDVGQILNEAGRFAAGVLAPLDPVGDRVGSKLENGVVRTPDGFAEAWRAFTAAGWNGLPFAETHGGQDLPWALATAVGEMWDAANLSFALCPLLTQASIEALARHGTPEQQALYLPKLVAGTWTGAMCLTEPQAGTDLGALRTRAVPDGDAYRIIGQKIYITFGDHDMAENVIHMVLARLPDAPAGPRGISLFLVPRHLPDADGNPGRRNDWRVAGLEHKLGIHASPTCTIVYGDDGGAQGWLVGEPHGGLRCMFTMMNNARLAVGREGLAVAERAFQKALAWARVRVQGQREGRPATIAAWPDVRRQLATMQATIAAMRGLVYMAAVESDVAQRHLDPSTRERAACRVALLTPIVKAWCTDRGCEVASAAIQVHGGMGFIEETGVGRHYRDVRITPIYEGANGIQALDLAVRKMQLDGGRLPWELLDELRVELGRLPQSSAAALSPAVAVLERATKAVQVMPTDDAAAGSTPFLQLWGWTLGGFMLARGAAASKAGSDRPVLARFYLDQLLPPALGLIAAVEAGSSALPGFAAD